MKSKFMLVALSALVLAGGLVAYMVLTGSTAGLRAGFNAEFMRRPDGYRGLSKAYGFEFASEPTQLATGRMHKACAEGAVDVISAFETDGLIETYDLLVLKDDRRFFPPYDAAPIARSEVLRKHPEVKNTLEKLAGAMDVPTMRRMNYAASREHNAMKPETVAREFLDSAGLLSGEPQPTDPDAETIRVGNKNFTEQRILGAMIELLLTHHTGLRITRIEELASDRIFPALDNDEIDVYIEYTGTGLMNILKRPPMSGAERVYNLVKQDFKDTYDIVWLAPLGFSNSYTLTMRRKHAKELGIETISELAAYVNEHNH